MIEWAQNAAVFRSSVTQPYIRNSLVSLLRNKNDFLRVIIQLFSPVFKLEKKAELRTCMMHTAKEILISFFIAFRYLR